MAHDPRRIIEALLSKTVANGCTPGEAASARQKAEELARRHGIDISPPKTTKPNSRFRDSYTMDDVAEAMRRGFGPQFQEAMRQAARRAAEQAFRQRQEQRVPDFKTVGECCEFYCRPGWVNSKTKRPLSNAEIAILVRCHFPHAHTTAKTVASYKSRAKREGRL